MKSVMKARESGKTLKNSSKRAKQDSQKSQTRKEEMLDLFQSDMTDGKQARIRKGNLLGKKKKSSFKSKSRYGCHRCCMPCTFGLDICSGSLLVSFQEELYIIVTGLF